MTAIQHDAAHQSPAQHALAAAKSRFVDAVSRGIDELMSQCGYSRERATAALLRELGRGDVSPNTNEVFDTMTAYGLGLDDASQALTVSRAVRRAMNERGLSAVEAIDDLSSKLNVTKLVASPGDNELEEQESPMSSSSSSSRPSSPEHRVVAPTPTSANNDRVSIQQRKGKKVNAKTNHKNGKQKAPKGHHNNAKNQSRKRSAPGSDELKQDVTFPSSRERADSVAEAVEAKAKKARLSPEESAAQDVAAEQLPSSTNPIIVRRSKRSSAGTHRGEQDAQSNAV